MQKLAWCLRVLAAVAVLGVGAAAPAAEAEFKPPFSWTLSPPLISPAARPENPCVSVKDPTVVFADGLWHVFVTARYEKPPVRMEYVAFDKWENADKAPRHLFAWYDRYFCAPQVFYFRPHKKWYLVYQVGEPSRNLKLQPAYATTGNIGDPKSWSPGKLFFPEADPKGFPTFHHFTENDQVIPIMKVCLYPGADFQKLSIGTQEPELKFPGCTARYPFPKRDAVNFAVTVCQLRYPFGKQSFSGDSQQPCCSTIGINTNARRVEDKHPFRHPGKRISKQVSRHDSIYRYYFSRSPILPRSDCIVRRIWMTEGTRRVWYVGPP